MEYTKEIWKPVPGYEEYYLVSNTGLIKSLHYKSPKLLKPHPDKDGYYKCSFVNKGTKRTKPIHRFVAQVFVPNPENKPCVNHKDGDKTNNNYWNLEWCTVEENNRHAITTGLRHGVKGEKNYWYGKTGGNHPKSVPVVDIETGAKYESITEAAAAVGLKRRSLANMLSGFRKNWTNLRYLN